MSSFQRHPLSQSSQNNATGYGCLLIIPVIGAPSCAVFGQSGIADEPISTVSSKIGRLLVKFYIKTTLDSNEKQQDAKIGEV